MIEVRSLTVTVRRTGEVLLAGGELVVPAGVTATLCGQSGSGKSTVARSLLGWVPAGLAVQGHLRVAGVDPSRMSASALRTFRQRIIGYVDQDPAESLNPHHRISEIVAELESSPGEGARWAEMLQLPVDADFLGRRIGQVSGGQRRRIALARHAAANPQVLVLDEPSSGLDARAREALVEALDVLRDRSGITLLVVTHDPELTAALRPDHRFRMAEGTIRPEEPVAATPPTTRPEPVSDHDGVPALRVSGLTATPAPGVRPVCQDLDLEIAPGQGVALLGPSGIGKTTVARAILGTAPPGSGVVEIDGQVLPSTLASRTSAQRRLFGYVPQDPGASLNPRRSIGTTLDQTLVRVTPRAAKDERRQRAVELCRLVGLDEEHLQHRPSQLSGGQRQRACLARALALSPRVLICDEATSSLDTVTEQQVVEVLRRLRDESGLALLVITHSDAVADALCDRFVFLDRPDEVSDDRDVVPGHSVEVALR